jgi:hypothetical protein
VECIGSVIHKNKVHLFDDFPLTFLTAVECIGSVIHKNKVHLFDDFPLTFLIANIVIIMIARYNHVNGNGSLFSPVWFTIGRFHIVKKDDSSSAAR